jgi:hypothetical protein
MARAFRHSPHSSTTTHVPGRALTLVWSSVIKPEQLFTALDGRRIKIGPSQWKIAVCGVFDGADRRWVQIALHGASERLATLELRLSDDAKKVRNRLARALSVRSTSVRSVA